MCTLCLAVPFFPALLPQVYMNCGLAPRYALSTCRTKGFLYSLCESSSGM